MFHDFWIENDYEHGDEIYQIDCCAELDKNNSVLYIFTVDLFDGQITGTVY